MWGRSPLLRSWMGPHVWLGATLPLALLAWAYRPLVWIELPNHSQIEGWFFRPTQLPAALIIPVAAWLVWRRRARLLALPARCSWVVLMPGLALGGALFVWAYLTGATDLLLPSLALLLLAFAAATRGIAGCRVLALPAFVLLLGARIPAPLEDDLVWRLQLWTTSASAWLVESLGRELAHGGVMLRTADHSFQVIDGCSGFRGISILVLVALLVRDIFSRAGRRMWLLLPIAAVLGFALNVVRVAYVATSPDPEALAGMQGDHTPQGIAVLLAGTAILYAAALGLAAGRGHDEAPRGADRSDSLLDIPATLAIGWPAFLAVLSLGSTPFALPRDAMSRPANPLPERAKGWTSEPLVGDPFFFGSAGQLLHRRYLLSGKGEAQAVEVFVGFEVAGHPETSQLLSSKLRWPGPDWDVVRESRTTLWLLQRDADLTTAVRRPGGEHAVVYSWRTGDLGTWRESIRSWLALESTPLRRARPRMVIRLIAFAPHDGPLVLDRAKQRLDRFIAVFREELVAL